MAVEIDIGSLIERLPEVRGGRPTITGTGVSVRTIVVWNQSGMSPDEIVREMPHLNLAQIFAALSYYHANRASVDQDIADEAAFFATMETHRNQGIA